MQSEMTLDQAITELHALNENLTENGMNFQSLTFAISVLRALSGDE